MKNPGPNQAAGTTFGLEDISVVYDGVPVLQAKHLSIASGEALAVVGPSGAGKTTLLRTLGAALRPSSGRVEIDGEALERLPADALRRCRASIGFIHQDLALVPNLRVVQNVLVGSCGSRSFAATLRAMLYPSRADLRRAHEILERVGISEKLYQRCDRLSGGQQQRVAVARALFQEPRALLADEPVSSVDPARARDMVALLRNISAEQGLTLCMSIHNLALAREFFPRIVGLRRGRIVFDRATANIADSDFDSLYELDGRSNHKGHSDGDG